MLLPVIILGLATLSAGAMAYGTDPRWAQLEHGLSIIMLARRLQWPLVALSLLLCMSMVALVIAGKRRAWWLIGLAPVLALFVHRFSAGPDAGFAVNGEPVFIEAENASFVGPEDQVVGLQFQDEFYAMPCATLYRWPVVAHADHDKRMLLMWSAPANRAMAVNVTRELRARDLDVVSMPAGALLLYNTRIGQFINALTARTPDGHVPDGFGDPIPTTKTTWQRWVQAHPRTRVLAAPGGGSAGGPTAPLPLPRQLPPVDRTVPPDTLIALVGTSPPVAVLPERLGPEPINLASGDAAVFVFRDGQGVARGFDRHVEPDLTPRFRSARGEGRRGAAFIDNYTDTAWSSAGVALDGELKGTRLPPVSVEEGLYWGVMKHWYPALELHGATTQPSRD